MSKCYICGPGSWSYTPGGIVPVCEKHLKVNHKIMKGKPLSTNVRIQIESSNFTALQQVDEKETRTEKATVLEVGEEVSLVKVGDTILFKAYNLDEIDVDGEKYAIIPEEDIKYIWTTSTTTKQ